MDISVVLAAIALLGFFGGVIWFSARQKKLARLHAEEEQRQYEEARQRHEEAVRRRRDYLIQKFSSAEIADAIIARRIWQGMSSEHLMESWGEAEDMDEKVYKTKTTQIWKYGNTGKNRYSQRVYLENGIVVGWQNQ